MWVQCIYSHDFHEIRTSLRGSNNLLTLHQIINRTWFPFFSRWNSWTTPRYKYLSYHIYSEQKVLLYLRLYGPRYNKVRKSAKIRNQYNQVPHLTQDTNGKVTYSQSDTTNESQEASPFPAGDHKAPTNRCVWKHNKSWLCCMWTTKV